MSWSAGQAWPAYNSLIGALISSISARGSSWLQMKWIWFGLWLRAKHLLRPEEVIEEEVQARWNRRDWRPANRTARPSVLLVCGGERTPNGSWLYCKHLGSGRSMEILLLLNSQLLSKIWLLRLFMMQKPGAACLTWKLNFDKLVKLLMGSFSSLFWFYPWKQTADRQLKTNWWTYRKIW